jgi:hypothetical protein
MIDRVRFLYEASAPLTARIPVLICRGELVLRIPRGLDLLETSLPGVFAVGDIRRVA